MRVEELGTISKSECKSKSNHKIKECLPRKNVLYVFTLKTYFVTKS